MELLASEPCQIIPGHQLPLGNDDDLDPLEKKTSSYFSSCYQWLLFQRQFCRFGVACGLKSKVNSLQNGQMYLPGPININFASVSENRLATLGVTILKNV